MIAYDIKEQMTQGYKPNIFKVFAFSCRVVFRLIFFTFGNLTILIFFLNDQRINRWRSILLGDDAVVVGMVENIRNIKSVLRIIFWSEQAGMYLFILNFIGLMLMNGSGEFLSLLLRHWKAFRRNSRQWKSIKSQFWQCIPFKLVMPFQTEVLCKTITAFKISDFSSWSLKTRVENIMVQLSSIIFHWLLKCLYQSFYRSDLSHSSCFLPLAVLDVLLEMKIQMKISLLVTRLSVYLIQKRSMIRLVQRYLFFLVNSVDNSDYQVNSKRIIVIQAHHWRQFYGTRLKLMVKIFKIFLRSLYFFNTQTEIYLKNTWTASDTLFKFPRIV